MEAKELQLAIVPTRSVLLHEEIERKRVDRLANRLKHDRVLKNPPIVTQVRSPGGPPRYVVLDGASRTSAFRTLEIPDIVVQIVDYDSPNVHLQSWNHLLLDVDPAELRADIMALPDLQLVEMDEASARSKLERREIICYLLFADGCVEGVTSGADRYAQARALAALVKTYDRKAELYRVATTNLEELAAKHHRLSAVVVFPNYRPDDILKLALNGAKVPAGITRHIIPGRALRINIPLDILETSRPLEEKNAWLDEWLEAKIQERRVRYYQEPVFLFDE
ncbi:MAG: hypothetical protein ACM3JD_18010 [Rudaea sp.]